jgi:xylan 1,4-beta-xylosidase
MNRWRPLAFLLLAAAGARAAEPATDRAEVRASFGERLGPLEMDRMGLGQGGLSEEPMWDGRIAEVRALKPRVIRLFLQDYFDFLPERGRYHFETFDRSLDAIWKTGARPLLSICFKPRVLFPAIDQDIVFPTDWEEWGRLVSSLVRHARARGAGGAYWEVANEPDIGEDGGCPYRFKPEDYVQYYRRTVEAVLRADPEAKVGGPALASSGSPILPALLESCEKEKIPLHFVSWHIYSSDPRAVRATIERVKGLLAKHPGLKPETVLDEWNMDLMNPPSDPRFQPCFILEVIWQMKEAGLGLSAYYHIRDFHVSYETFARIMSPHGDAFMTRWWNRAPQYDGLFDFEDAVRPAYFSFKLLARLEGERLRLVSSHPAVHGFLSHDGRLGIHGLLLWNFSAEAVPIDLVLDGLPKDMKVRPVALDAAAAGEGEDSRLRHLPVVEWKKGAGRIPVDLEPWAVRSWSME